MPLKNPAHGPEPPPLPGPGLNDSDRPPLRLLWSIAWRFLRGRRSQLLDGTARAALVATTLGVTAMVIAMALMTGYREDLKKKLIRGNAAVIAYPITPEGFRLDDATRAALESIPGLTEVRRVTYAQGSLASGEQPQGVEVTLRGVDPGQGLAGLGRVRLAPDLDPGGGLVREGMPAVVIGSELARKLEVEEGDVLRLMVLGFKAGRPRFRYQSVALGGTFRTGFSEFDQSWVAMGRLRLEDLMGQEVGMALFELAAAEAGRAPRIAEQARAVLGPDYLVTDWQDLNHELFTALRVQQIALFFVLGLIVLVSTFNVASSLVVLVRERMRDIGVLAALGLAPQRLRGLFLLYGGALGVAGTGCGIVLGSTVAWIVTRYELIRFEPELAAIYFISSVPFRVDPLDLVAVAAFSLAVTFLACWTPARRAGRLQPATALRYE
ncbi:MAG: ABC transporter permease [Thermoanaerobaculia bacterium]